MTTHEQFQIVLQPFIYDSGRISCNSKKKKTVRYAYNVLTGFVWYSNEKTTISLQSK